jgi:hypothetical protein
MLELLTRLAGKSLLQVDHSGRDARYYLLETIRDYARERLAEAGEDEPIRRAHLRCFVDLVERAGRRLEHRELELGKRGSVQRAQCPSGTSRWRLRVRHRRNHGRNLGRWTTTGSVSSVALGSCRAASTPGSALFPAGRHGTAAIWAIRRPGRPRSCGRSPR